MNVSLTEKQEKYIAAQIQSGDYQNASELVRDALRLHSFYRDRMVEDMQKFRRAQMDESIRMIEDSSREVNAGGGHDLEDAIATIAKKHGVTVQE